MEGRRIFISDSDYLLKVLYPHGPLTQSYYVLHCTGTRHTKAIQKRFVGDICLNTTFDQPHSNISKNNQRPKMVSVEDELTMLDKESCILL